MYSDSFLYMVALLNMFVILSGLLDTHVLLINYTLTHDSYDILVAFCSGMFICSLVISRCQLAYAKSF